MTRTVWQVYRTAMALDADLYQFHDPELIPIGLLLRARGKRVIYDVHEDAPRALLSSGRDYLPYRVRVVIGWLLERLERWAVRRLSGCIGATPKIARRFSAIQPHTETVNNFPMIGELAAAAAADARARSNDVVYVGALSMSRGLREVVAAMEHVPAHLGVRLKLAGRFDSSATRDELARLPGWTSVDELGFVNRTQLGELLRSARAGLVILHPEPNYVESQPTKLFEYMSAGVPFIASDFPFWRDLVAGEGCGLFVDPFDVRGIARAIEALASDPARAQAMGERGRALVQGRYNWTVEARKLLTLYAQVMDVPADSASAPAVSET